MRADVPELLFPSRDGFRNWLRENAEISDGVWLVFGKSKEVVTLSANDALEEALCFGWIDGQMQRIDDTKYRKYFARRRAKSVWSEKNKNLVETLRGNKMMTGLGEKAIETAIKNGMWDAPKGEPITDGDVEAFAAKLAGISPAYENFNRMPRSVRFTYTGRYLSFKSEQARQRDLERIIERLNKNLKPM
ncbi:MAG: YdeI/OmpD-associated family protein [Oscillospiraceae bacterium]|nr:YdeI/OmpD-associated family protein [Oscillospiraceae bacterium]